MITNQGAPSDNEEEEKKEEEEENICLPHKVSFNMWKGKRC